MESGDNSQEMGFERSLGERVKIEIFELAKVLIWLMLMWVGDNRKIQDWQVIVPMDCLKKWWLWKVANAARVSLTLPCRFSEN